VNAIPITAVTMNIARRVIWFEQPEKALADPIRFMAYAMAYAVHQDMRVIRRYVSDDDFREALDHAPPGIVDPRSWAYWNLKMGRYPPPPLPKRRFGTPVGEQPFQRSNAAPAGAGSLEDQRRAGRVAWQKIREQTSTLDTEETRRRAREEWLAKYGPGRKI
jgi:hypothetical protein